MLNNRKKVLKNDPPSKITRQRIFLLFILLALGTLCWYIGKAAGFHTGCNADADYAEGVPVYYREETYGNVVQRSPEKLPKAEEDTGFDVRFLDLSVFDLSEQDELLQEVWFNSKTVWPNKLPEGFIPETVLEEGKNPGLGIRRIHDEGYTGKGISIAIVDTTLNLDHVEYKDNIKGYELLHAFDEGAGMHGSAVTSIAAGTSCGVAPNADIYYIASSFFRIGFFGTKRDLTYMAKSINRILEINQILPDTQKISVISISCGFDPNTLDGRKVFNAIEKAKRKNVFVITPSLELNYDVEIRGLGRPYNEDPDCVESYVPGLFWQKHFYENPEMLNIENTLLIPMDSRTYGDWESEYGYEFCSRGGLSWAVPWLAGLYALCREANPSITPEMFLSVALETGTEKEFSYNGNSYSLGTIVNPSMLIQKIQKEEEAG